MKSVTMNFITKLPTSKNSAWGEIQQYIDYSW
jgi:hypothetical protein